MTLKGPYVKAWIQMGVLEIAIDLSEVRTPGKALGLCGCSSKGTVTPNLGLWVSL